jgi:hypothetical protein
MSSAIAPVYLQPTNIVVGLSELQVLVQNFTITMEWTLEITCEGLDLMHLTQDRDHWWALVNMVLKLQVP